MPTVFPWGPTRWNTPQCTLRLSCCASHAGTRPRINSDWGLGDWLKTKSWTIDEGHALLQNPAILNAVIDHLSPLFPGYQLPDEAGGLFVGALTCFDCRYNIITYYDIITQLNHRSMPYQTAVPFASERVRVSPQRLGDSGHPDCRRVRGMMFLI